MNSTTTSNKTFSDWLAYALFWSWNIIFLAFMTLGFAPRILPDLIPSVQTRLVPIEYLIYAVVLTIIPLAAVILGLTVLRRQPRKQFKLGYVVEGPLMLVLAVRFFVIRQASSGLVFLMLAAFLGMAAYTWYLLDPQGEKRGSNAGWLRLAGLTLMGLTSLYAAVWIGFYAVPLATEATRWLGSAFGDLAGIWRSLVRTFSDIRPQDLVWIPFSLLGLILLVYTATLFVLAPVVVPYLSLNAWWRSLRNLAGRHGWVSAAALVSLVLALCAASFVVANRQPQGRIFTLLSEPPQSRQEARALLDEQEAIRVGLLNAYLAPFRYISATGEVVHIKDIYESTFNLDPNDAFVVQRAYEEVARPLIYSPAIARKPSASWRDNMALVEEPGQAAKLYQQFFDQTIVDGERSEIVQAVRTSWSADQVEAAWQAVDDREVYLQRQEVNMFEHEDWAEIELMEVYQNQTADEQEVVYYFNLPESAVLTGLWLGNSQDREARFSYVVAPRGAAQATFRNEKRLNLDPALLEQIGPRQYRLRVFPVPPIVMNWNDDGTRQITSEAPPLYLWMKYITFADQDKYPLPQLAEKRNVYWDKGTLTTVNGEPRNREQDAWLPNSVPASQDVVPQAHRVDFPNNRSVLAVPVDQTELPGLPQDLDLAVVLDRSFSMGDYAQPVSDSLAFLQEAAGAETDVYLTASPYRGEEPALTALGKLQPDDLVNFGGQNPAELLAQFEQLRGNRDYDAVIVISDGSGYELGENQDKLPVPAAPVWLVHMDSAIPLGYDDQTLEYIQASGGGVSGDVKEALTRLAVSLSTATRSTGKDQVSQDVLDSYVWKVLPVSEVEASSTGLDFAPDDSGFAPFAARRLVLAEMQSQRGQLDDLAVLDTIHSLAKETGIVTPYSSMIVLVTPQQKNRLEQLEKDNDRYEREYEAVGETAPLNPLPLGGVPEPHEWLLIGIGSALLIYFAYKRKLAIQPGL